MNVRRIAKAAEKTAAGTPETQAISSFLRGLTAGALIGAAIAGSALIQRRRAVRHIERQGPEDSSRQVPDEIG